MAVELIESHYINMLNNIRTTIYYFTQFHEKSRECLYVCGPDATDNIFHSETSVDDYVIRLRNYCHNKKN